MTSRYDRWQRLETGRAKEALELIAEQIAVIQEHNPAFKERHVESSRPGELLHQDTFYVGRVFLHAVVDTCSSYAFGFLHTTKLPRQR